MCSLQQKQLDYLTNISSVNISTTDYFGAGSSSKAETEARFMIPINTAETSHLLVSLAILSIDRLPKRALEPDFICAMLSSE